MRGDFDEDELPDDDYDFDCQTCGGEGVIVVCIDDLCQAGECIHGDGMAVCPECGGE